MAHVYLFFQNALLVFISNGCHVSHVTHSFVYFLFSDLYPPVEEIVDQCGKFRLLDRLLEQLFAHKHKVC